MPTREDLKALIEDLPDKSLDQVHRMLQFHISPPAPQPEMQRMQQRNMRYRQAVQARVHSLRKAGTIAIGGGSGFSSTHNGMPFSRQSFHYWDEKTLIYQSLQIFDGQEIEIIERLSFAPDQKQLQCAIEITSGGRTAVNQEAFAANREHLPEG